MSKVKFRPSYLCGKPECEANVRGIMLERDEIIAAQAEEIKRLSGMIRDMKCSGNCNNLSDGDDPCNGSWRSSRICPCKSWELLENGWGILLPHPSDTEKHEGGKS